MKLTVNGYTVTITAKKERAWREPTRQDTKNDTMSFLCNLSSAFFDAASESTRHGLSYHAKDCQTAATDIYKALDKAHYFDDIKTA